MTTTKVLRLGKKLPPAFSWSSRGDVMNAFVVINALAYLFFFLLAHSGVSALFTRMMDERTRIDGFCIANPDDPYANSHMLSFYVDVVFSIVSLAVVHSTPAGSPSRDLLGRSIPGTLGHGIGHFFISVAGGSPVSGISSLPLYLQLAAPPVNFFFWYSLLGTNKYIPKNHLLPMSSVHVVVTSLPILPKTAGFTYVQTVLVLTFAFYEVFFRPREDKDMSYDWEWATSVPFMVVSWVEATACTSFLRDIGGHMWYDASIPSAILLYYFAVRGLEKPKKLME
jgi:hypothetical protein